ncbi:uncharacterized protein LOC129237820 [Anastrepha obliqua]|uniref:uncharacterized protein LOC129237820 n=1 Tax=Anastrepha obliqua TaxID=95512 RepID=UPI002409D701|nr:uncharacterized protein LOC129237820 [Anastrepha obliqua]
MSEVMELSEDIRNIFCKYKEKQKVDLFRTLNDVKCCECGHQSRIRNVQNKTSIYRRMTIFYQFILSILTILLLMATYALWAARRYNHVRLFGTGGCTSTFLWTYDDCIVAR